MGRENKKSKSSRSVDPHEPAVALFDDTFVESIIDDSAEVGQIEPITPQPAVETPPPSPVALYRIEVQLSPEGNPNFRPVAVDDPVADRDDPRHIPPVPGSVSSTRGVGAAHVGSPSFFASDLDLNAREVVIDANGQPRQAGAATAEGEYIKRFKRRAEQSLFVFLKGVLGRFFLTPHFHREICHFIQTCPPHRKLVLMPREHAKTTIVAGGLPPHILIQPAETNIYFPGIEGSECRILLAGETETMAKKNLRVITNVFEENKLLRAFWPHRCWPGGGKGKVWSSESIIIPRDNEWPDPTIRAIGVGGAVTGARPNVMIKDDLVSFKAANSDVTMDEAIEWHKASRALLDKYEVESGLQSLEFIIGTRWAVYDLYSYIIDKDSSVEVNDSKFHRIINDDKILWHEKYTQADIEQMQREHGAMFYLLYLNSAADPELTDFDMNLVRPFEVRDGLITFEEDVRDSLLEKQYARRRESLDGIAPPVAQRVQRGVGINEAILERLTKGAFGMRLRA